MNENNNELKILLDDDISVIICTHNRSDSLRITLKSLMYASKDDISFSVVVVDNNSTDDTQSMLKEFSEGLSILYLLETRIGKSYCLNNALDSFQYPNIMAFIDDDITVSHNWFETLILASQRYPEHDIFTGNSYIIWPTDSVPKWASSGILNGFGFSVENPINVDKPFEHGSWPSGNHFWIRSRVLETGIRFDEPLCTDFAPTGCVSDPDFHLKLISLGFKGMRCASAIVGHRVQQELLNKSTMLKRAKIYGRTIPYIRSVYPNIFFRARLLKHSIAIYWFAHFLKLLKCLFDYYKCFFSEDADTLYAKQVLSTAQICNNWEALSHPLRIRKKLLDNEHNINQLLNGMKK